MAGSQHNSGDSDQSAGQRQRSSGNQSKSEFQAAVERLEEAVQELVGSATNEFTDRASSLVDDITEKIQTEFGAARDKRSSGQPSNWRVELGLTADDLGYGDDDLGLDDDYGRYGADDYSADDGRTSRRSRRGSSAQRMRERRRQRRRQMPHNRVRTSRLYRDTEHAKIGGVCAGLANYYGMETWVVRCLAVTGLLFMGQIVFPAYWIAYFVMDTPQKVEARRRPSKRGRRTRDDMQTQRIIPPGQTLRNVELDLNQAELRLRRIESHVTSGHYELQKELNRIDPKSPVNGGDHLAQGSK